MFSRLPESLTEYGSGVCLNISNSGAASTCGGSMLPAVNTISSAMLNRQLNRDTANATIDASRRVSITVGMTMIAEFLKSVAKPACFQRLAEVAQGDVLGHAEVAVLVGVCLRPQ